MNQIVRSKPYYKGVTKDFKSPLQDNKLTYIKGQIIEADGFDVYPGKKCGHGINFCDSLAEALTWAEGGTVVEVTVPEGELIVQVGNKLRARRVLVGNTVTLYGANLDDANLAFTNLYEADLSRANLTYANLTNVNLKGANLTNADLYGANLTGADLRGADLTRADLRGAYGLHTVFGKPASLPEGWEYTDGKGIHMAAPQDPEPTCHHIQHGKFCSDCGAKVAR